jgi:hypothetical protein
VKNKAQVAFQEVQYQYLWSALDSSSRRGKGSMSKRFRAAESHDVGSQHRLKDQGSTDNMTQIEGRSIVNV